jgi:hypothetical protein
MYLALPRARFLPALAALLAISVPSFAVAAEFLPHRAVYALSKGGGRPAQGVSSLTGTMLIELDESCDGWSLSQRVRMSLTDSMGDTVDSDSRYASHESKDGTALQFAATDWQNGSLIEETIGSATRDAVDQPGTVEFTKPAGETAELPANALFPAAFNLHLIALGDGFHSMIGFDGGNTDGAYTITAFVGKPRTSAVSLPDELTAPAAGALGGPVRNVRVAYFPIAGQSPEPELEYEMELQPNGVSPTMRLDYQRYAVKATLVEFTALPRPRCGP